MKIPKPTLELRLDPFNGDILIRRKEVLTGRVKRDLFEGDFEMMRTVLQGILSKGLKS
jgi:hypothetical protein